MYRTFYETATGRIVICRKMNDDAVAQRQLVNTDQSFINEYCINPEEYKVDLSSLTLVESPKVYDFQGWMRQRRNLMLLECDWTVGADSPLSDSKKTEWQTYRQALRDVPDSHSSISSKQDVTWPTKPE